MEIGSEWSTTGISTGSLGPTLFLIYINNLDDDITSKVLKFAHNTKVFRKIKSDADRQHLQDDLNKFTEWTEKWQMLFNFGSVSASTQDMGMKMHNILYYTILYYTILYYTILYYTILYYTILYYTILNTTLKNDVG